MNLSQLKIFFEGNSITKDTIYNCLNFTETTIEECDVIVSSKFEVGIYKTNDIQKKINSYKKTNKLVLIFLVSDNSKKLSIPYNVLLFRTSLCKSSKDPKEYLLPYIWECFETAANPLEKSEKPKIGFCGNVNKNIGKRLSTIELMQNDTRLETDFILRKGFWAGKPNDEQLKKDYITNLINSHFTICNKGRGNFAIRFYQALSMGRIPVLIDSDMVFPFEDKLNWNEIIITANNEKQLVEKIIDWWESKNNDEVINAQVNCREVYNQFLTQESFTKELGIILQNKVNSFVSEIHQNKSFINKIFGNIFK